ncbi:MAG: glycosyltransferase [Nitrososphaeria archaeon]
MISKEPLVSIIILTKNAGKHFEELMRKIRSQKFSEKFEILVVDSGSSDSTLNTAKKNGARIFEIRPQDFHHGRTRNLAAKLAQGRYLVYITQDALPVDSYWLKNLVNPLKNDEKAAVVYGRQIAYPNAKPMEKFFYNYFYPKESKILTFENAKDPSKFYLENAFISNVNSAIRREAWKDTRFRNDIIMAEDKDFALRILKKGWKIVYEPAACVYHSHNYSPFSLFKRRLKDGDAFKQITGQSNVSSYSQRYIMKYLSLEAKFLWQKHKFYIFYGLFYEIMGVLGFTLGNKLGVSKTH